MVRIFGEMDTAFKQTFTLVNLRFQVKTLFYVGRLSGVCKTKPALFEYALLEDPLNWPFEALDQTHPIQGRTQSREFDVNLRRKQYLVETTFPYMDCS